jgi:hypothetical protein
MQWTRFPSQQSRLSGAWVDVSTGTYKITGHITNDLEGNIYY